MSTSRSTIVSVRINSAERTTLPHVYVDADDCPVKEEVVRVAKRYGLRVTFVANTWMQIAERDGIEIVVVPKQPDAADDWIAEHVAADDIVICSDIPLAARCVEREATAINSRGRLFTEDDIGETLATRDLLSSLRESGLTTGGPKPYGPRDRSQFLQSLDKQVHVSRKSRKLRALE